MPDHLATTAAGSGALLPRKSLAGMAYIDRGQGEAVVLVHGVGLNADAWEPQIGELAKTHRVIALDMPGHGQSSLAAHTTDLDGYVQEVAQLLDGLGIQQANLVGHSMGGLVAIGFALAFPARTLRLVVLNSVYDRPAAKRQAVQERAREIIASGNRGNVEVPLERWFGPRHAQPAIAQQVRGWLQGAPAAGYGRAYEIFASSDQAFVGKLQKLAMPCLFATGSDDENSNVAMADAMTKACPRGKLWVLDGARHMMNLTHPDAVSSTLAAFLETPLMDLKDLRKAFGTFMTGVTVVTTRDSEGQLRGFTANSFSSVSLDPPLLLICISKLAASCDVFENSASFAVNILAETQKETSGIFASKRADKFTEVAWQPSALGNPLLTGSVAWFDCTNFKVVDAGDHIILIGLVKHYAHNDQAPLGYGRGGYFTLGLEQMAVNAAAESGRTEVGAIIEFQNQLLVFETPQGFTLPHVGTGQGPATTSHLMAYLQTRGVKAKFGFLYAVYENSEARSQSIYYRAEAETAGNAVLLNFEDLPWGKFRDDATRAMLKRYCSERQQGRYKIYSGNHLSGDVRDVGDAQ